MDNLRGFYSATRYQILRVVPFADPPPFFVFYLRFAGPSVRMRVGDYIRSQARRASLAPVWLPSTRGLIPRETTGSGRCICAKRVQRVSSGSGRSGAEWRGANGAAGNGGERRGDEKCMGHRVSHGHRVHCPEPRPQGHRPTEPIVPFLCSSAHFCRVLALVGHRSVSSVCIHPGLRPFHVRGTLRTLFRERSPVTEYSPDAWASGSAGGNRSHGV